MTFLNIADEMIKHIFYTKKFDLKGLKHWSDCLMYVRMCMCYQHKKKKKKRKENSIIDALQNTTINTNEE